MFGLEGEDSITDLLWQYPMPGGFRRREEARHTVFLKGSSLTVEGAPQHAGDSGTLVRRVAEEDHGTDHLVEALLGELGEQIQLLPVVRGFLTRAQTCRHGCSRAGGAPPTSENVVPARPILCRIPCGR